MALPTNFSIVVDSGGGTTATVVIPIPTTGTYTSNSAASIGGTIGDVEALAQNVAKNGFWDTARANFFPATAIRKITPQ
jgi:hypothetical protein